jgi:hypothetical protein
MTFMVLLMLTSLILIVILNDDGPHRPGFT